MGFYKFSCHSPPFSQLVSVFLPLPVNMSVTPACEILNRNSKNYMCSFWKQTLNPVQMKSLVVLFCYYPIEFHLTFQCTGGLLSPWARSERQIFFKKIWIVTLYTSVSPLHMKTYDLIRAGGLSLCPVWLTTNIVPGIFSFFFHIHSNLSIYDGYVIFFEQVGVGEEALSDFFVGHPFSSWGIKDHRCVTPLMWSKEEEKEELQIWHRCTLEILIHSHQVHVGRWRSSLINSCTCHTLRLHRQSLSFRFTVDGHFLFFFHFPSLLSFLAGRIKFYCIVYDRYEARFGANSRQTTHSHFMVSFHLTR